MIQNLNPLTFSKYGQIFTPKEYTQMKNESSKTRRFLKASPLFFTGGHHLFLDVVEFPTLLMIMYDQCALSSNKYDIYLLDKPVRLEPRVYFRIIPMHHSCSVEFYPSSVPLDQYFYSLPDHISAEYKVQIPRIYVAFYQEKEKGFYFKGEHHPCWELAYVDIGEMYSVVNNQKSVVRQGELVFYAPNQHHIQYAAKNISVNFFSISFDLELEMTSWDLLLNQKFRISRSHASLLNKIIQESTSSNLYSADMMQCHLKEFMVLFLRTLTPRADNQLPYTTLKQNSEENIIEEVCNYVNENIFQPITVSDIAQHVNLSVPYLSSLFHRKKEVRLIEYITHKKLEKSKEMIRDGQYTITQIAEMLGYSSLHYFSRVFKAHYNIAPSEYAKALR
ncbi:MAG: AraC family transcriptional regulator [Eubacteriales bacterium]|nr:AraC family transcriptional regulator [Eubacteriales bacterium]